MPYAAARRADTVGPFDFLGQYVDQLPTVVNLDAIRDAGIRIGADPLGGASVAYWAEIAARYGLDLTVVNPAVDATFRFMTLDWDGKIRMDCSSRYAMASLIGQAAEFAIATGNDTDADRHGIVTPDAGLLDPNHYLAVAIDYLYRHRANWPAGAAVGKTMVSSSIIDRVAAAAGRELTEVPVGFKWFVPGLLDGSIAFGGEESAGASFLRADGRIWTTDKDGIILALLASEIAAVTGQSPGQRYRELADSARRPGLRPDRRARHPGPEGAAGQAVPGAGRCRGTGRGAGARPADPRTGQRRATRRHQGDHRVRLVRRASLGHRGCLQAVCGVVPGSRPAGPDPGRSAAHSGWRAQGIFRRLTPAAHEGCSMADKRVLGIVLAGGAGKRLAPLTADRAKPAVPFGGMYRLVDFALSNLANAGIYRIAVLTQYKSHSLDRHISTAWRMSTLLGNYVTPVPAQQRLGPHWYTGSADAIYQSLNLIYDERPDLVIVFGADHVYRMDPRQMIDQHVEHGAGVTVAAIPVPRGEASAFGIVHAGADGRTLEEFLEKPADPPPLPGRPEECYASMGNYLFSTDVLIEALRKDAASPTSRHDMGGDIIPMMVEDGTAHVYDFQTNKVPGATERDAGYWRDVGTLDSYFDSHMDLCAVHPVFNLYNDRWPILTHVTSQPPAKFVHDSGDRVGRAIDSLVSNGVIVSGGLVRQSVLSPGVRVNSWSRVERSVILNNTIIGRHAVIENAIIDKNVTIPEGVVIGVDKEQDRARGFAVSAGGITVVGKSQKVTG